MLIDKPIERTLAVVGLAGVALIHLLDLHDTYLAAPYKGWLYLALIAGSLAAAAALVRADDRRAWLAALVLPAGAFAAFVWSRTIGLPGGADDIGNWWEPLGLAAEGAVGDADPLLALGDALVLFPPDEVLIATHPPRASCWLERDVVARAQARVAAPVHQIGAEGERVAA